MMLPSIHDALEIRKNHGKRLIVEVQQHIGENTVRTVAMDSTDAVSYTHLDVYKRQPMKQLIDACGGLPEDTGKIIGGGPMMRCV